MSFFKKVIFLGAALLVGCSGKGTQLKHWMENSETLKILSTTAQIGDIVSEIGGERIQNLVLIQGELNPHSYELVKGDDEKIGRADLVFYNGLGLEHGASLFSLLQSSPKAVPVGDIIAQKIPDKILKREGVVDPHLWMDISIWKESIKPITESLAKIDPEGAEYYRSRSVELVDKMEKVHVELKEKLKTIPSEKRYLMTSHDAFRYFTRSYLADEGEVNWERRFAAPEGLAPDGQLSPIDIQRMIDYLKEKKLTVLFPESNVSRDSIKKIASAGNEIGIDVHVCTEPLFGDSLGSHSYLEMMRSNADVIARNLK